MAEYLFPFEKLDVYHLALDLAEFVLELLEKLPQNRHIRLISQMEAAVTSPAQNIAEGKGRQYKKEFIQFLHIARGSVFEVVTLNEIFMRRALFSNRDSIEIREMCERIDRKLNGLINSLRGKKRNKPVEIAASSNKD
jgi:four helix bundle protein